MPLDAWPCTQRLGAKSQYCPDGPHALPDGVYDPHGPKVRGGTDGGAVKTPVGPRAGIGVALSNGVRLGIPLPGKRQTAQRAEVAGLALALEYTTGPLTLAVDNEYVCNMAVRVKQRCRHADYWRYIARNIHKLEEIRWIKSHLTLAQARYIGFPDGDWQ